MLTYARALELLINQRVYEEELVKVVDNDGKVFFPRNIAEIVDIRKEKPITVKLDALEILDKKCYLFSRELERYHNKPCTVHLFWADKDSLSFGLHTDPMKVYLKVIHGFKIMEHLGRDIKMDIESPFYCMEPNTEHRPINKTDSMMLSIGIENHIGSSL